MIDKLFELDQAAFNFSDEGKIWLDIVIGFIMFGIALGLKLSDFKILISNPKPILVGMRMDSFSRMDRVIPILPEIMP